LSNYLLIPIISTVKSLRPFTNKPKNAWIPYVTQAEIRNASKCAPASKTDKLDEASHKEQNGTEAQDLM
jgi:hypothetical protein